MQEVDGAQAGLAAVDGALGQRQRGDDAQVGAAAGVAGQGGDAVVPQPRVRVAGVDPDGVQHLDLAAGQAAAGDAEHVEVDPVEVFQLAVQVVAAKHGVAAGVGGADAGAQAAGVLLQQGRAAQRGGGRVVQGGIAHGASGVAAGSSSSG
ncbi:hypothetical protein [Rugamonas sp. DEMB1]|uniref:hypothetical protein n=1 Tax=Rugamonas sp. DEMB1 TaxID=3039386 RepID=UPI00244808AD|nr:hypothetical protein [Rugamonas sp. DEMB1]WGG53262.1 hypothetical protein QC826_14800 [Rugamonas sp. DEMB1]